MKTIDPRLTAGALHARRTTGQAGGIHAGAGNSVDVGPAGNEAKLPFGFAPAGAASTSGAWAPVAERCCVCSHDADAQRTTGPKKDHRRRTEPPSYPRVNPAGGHEDEPEDARECGGADHSAADAHAHRDDAGPDDANEHAKHPTATATATDRPARQQRTATKNMVAETAERPPAIPPTPTPATTPPTRIELTSQLECDYLTR